MRFSAKGASVHEAKYVGRLCGTKWVSGDLPAHTVEVTGVKTSAPLRRGGRFAVTFSQAGTSRVVCVQRPFMTMTVVVEP